MSGFFFSSFFLKLEKVPGEAQVGQRSCGAAAMERCAVLSPSSSDVPRYLILHLCGPTMTRTQLSGQVLKVGLGECWVALKGGRGPWVVPAKGWGHRASRQLEELRA